MASIISTSNEEVDRQFGGGLPIPSFVVIEGDHGTGKSAINAQIMKGFLDSKYKILCVIENNVSDYLQKMKSITFNFVKSFVRDSMSFIPIYISNAKWTEENVRKILPTIKEHVLKKMEYFDIIVIDSISPIISSSDNKTMLEFITFCKNLVSKGKTVIISFHSSDLPKYVNTAFIGAADVYFKLGGAMVGDKEVRTLKIVKLLGAKDSPESGFAFEVDMIFGIKIVPVSMANA